MPNFRLMAWVFWGWMLLAASFTTFLTTFLEAEKPTFQTYQVRAGDNYYLIGKKFKINYPELVRLNQGKKLHAGTEIKIPDFFHYQVARNDSYYFLAKKFKVAIKWLQSLNRDKKLLIGDHIKIPREAPLTISLASEKEKSLFGSDRPDRSTAKKNQAASSSTSQHSQSEMGPEKIKEITQNLTFVWPVNGKIEQNFGVHEDILNQGILLKLDPNQKRLVYASEMGKAVFIDNIRGFGKTIILSHGKEVFSAYMGVAEVKKNLNQAIQKGDPIALGNKKVFFSIFIRGTPEDPLQLLKHRL